MNAFFFVLLALFALAQNVDNFVLAGAYRFRGVLIPRSSNALIAILSGLATASAAAAGWAFGQKIFEKGHGELTDLIARGLLIMLGVWALVGYLRKRLFPQLRKQQGLPQAAITLPLEASNHISHPEAILAATALAIDNLAPSFAFGVRHPADSFFSLLVLAILTAGLSMALVVLGQIAGKQGRMWFSNPAFRLVSPELVSGLLIIGVAILDPGDIAHRLF